MDPDQHQREKQSVIICVTDGDVPYSGYMLRFMQEHACLRIRTTPQMPHVYIVIVVSNFYFFIKMRFF